MGWLIKVEGEREDARQQTGATREEAAKLRGQCESLQTQVASLMQIFAERQIVPVAAVSQENPIR